MSQPAVQVVVGAAILRYDGGRVVVLAAQRAAPERLAGFWEFPGGKVEPGESDAEAVVRECREELGVMVVPGARLGCDTPLGTTGVLRVFVATISGDEEAVALEHAALRWVGAGEIDTLRWLPTNAPLLAPLRAILQPAASS